MPAPFSCQEFSNEMAALLDELPVYQQIIEKATEMQDVSPDFPDFYAENHPLVNRYRANLGMLIATCAEIQLALKGR